jgi:hypothetical protein
MKKLITLLLSLMTLGVFAQSAATSPGTGHWVVIDSGYQVATSTTGQTVTPLYFYNTSTNKDITGMQFKIKYDNTAFTAVVPSLKISTTSQVLNYVDNNTSGYLTVTLVYTGTSSTFSYSNGATFDLTFTHVEDDIWNNLDSIKSIKVNDITSWNDLASTSYGNDTTLVVYSYGGRMNQQMLRFAAKFKNVTGSNAKNLWVSLEKRVPGGTWNTVESKATNDSGHVVFFRNIDTTYWDVRLAVKGDTMSVGNVLSTADIQKINQTVLGQYTPTGFDFYTMDVNKGDGEITIADVYSGYGRLAGRFTEWPNAQKDVLFFTEAEFSTINGSSTNYAKFDPMGTNITGITNFYYDIDGKDSITYYVAVKGDANGTGFKMARITPIEIVNPINAPNYIIDANVSYDEPKSTIEINMPKIKVDEGNLVNVPVKVLTNGKELGALQIDLKYDTDYLEFKQIKTSNKIQKWTTYFNPFDGKLSWGGVDLTTNNMLKNNDDVLIIQFVAKKPQDEWTTAAVWTAEKYAGDKTSQDLNITPAMGIVQVRRVKGAIGIDELPSLLVFPNPTQDEVVIEFKIKEETNTELGMSDLVGRKVMQMLNERMPAGKYKYVTDLRRLDNGMYLLYLRTEYEYDVTKIIINK